MKFCYFPIQVLKSHEGFHTKIELKDGRIVIGTLEEMDIFMNLKMINVKIVKDDKVDYQDRIFIRGTILSGI